MTISRVWLSLGYCLNSQQIQTASVTRQQVIPEIQWDWADILGKIRIGYYKTVQIESRFYHTLGYDQTFVHGTKVSPHIWGLFDFTHLQWGNFEDIGWMPEKSVWATPQPIDMSMIPTVLKYLLLPVIWEPPLTNSSTRYR